jgi:hypothetical protein
MIIVNDDTVCLLSHSHGRWSDLSIHCHSPGPQKEKDHHSDWLLNKRLRRVIRLIRRGLTIRQRELFCCGSESSSPASYFCVSKSNWFDPAASQAQNQPQIEIDSTVAAGLPCAVTCDINWGGGGRGIEDSVAITHSRNGRFVCCTF